MLSSIFSLSLSSFTCFLSFRTHEALWKTTSLPLFCHSSPISPDAIQRTTSGKTKRKALAKLWKNKEGRITSVSNKKSKRHQQEKLKSYV